MPEVCVNNDAELKFSSLDLMSTLLGTEKEENQYFL